MKTCCLTISKKTMGVFYTNQLTQIVPIFCIFSACRYRGKSIIQQKRANSNFTLNKATYFKI